jgi:hypothetical protein
MSHILTNLIFSDTAFKLFFLHRKTTIISYFLSTKFVRNIKSIINNNQSLNVINTVKHQIMFTTKIFYYPQV